jgi:hypothetical protein
MRIYVRELMAGIPLTAERMQKGSGGPGTKVRPLNIFFAVSAVLESLNHPN